MGEGLSCGITVQPNGRPLTVASSDLLASQVDELQYGLDEGPCLASLRTGQVVRIDDLAADQRWPRLPGGRWVTAWRPRCPGPGPTKADRDSDARP
jgi:hypothetical protein